MLRSFVKRSGDYCGVAVLAVLCAFLNPSRADAVLCEIFNPCRYADSQRFIFVGTVSKIVEEQHETWPEAESIAYFQVDELLSGHPPRQNRFRLLNSMFETGKQYLVVATPWRDGYFVEWRGDDYRGFQTALACGPAFPIQAAHTAEYLSYFREALKFQLPVSLDIGVVSAVDAADLSSVFMHLVGPGGRYVVGLDGDGEAELKNVAVGAYQVEVWQAAAKLALDPGTSSRIELLAGSCPSISVGLAPPQ